MLQNSVFHLVIAVETPGGLYSGCGGMDIVKGGSQTLPYSYGFLN